jgi:hypothetical protein
VVEITPEFIEAVQRRQELIEITEMVLAELSGGIALALESGSDGGRLCGHT